MSDNLIKSFDVILSDFQNSGSSETEKMILNKVKNIVENVKTEIHHEYTNEMEFYTSEGITEEQLYTMPEGGDIIEKCIADETRRIKTDDAWNIVYMCKSTSSDSDIRQVFNEYLNLEDLENNSINITKYSNRINIVDVNDVMNCYAICIIYGLVIKSLWYEFGQVETD